MQAIRLARRFCNDRMLVSGKSAHARQAAASSAHTCLRAAGPQAALCCNHPLICVVFIYSLSVYMLICSLIPLLIADFVSLFVLSALLLCC